MYISDFGNEQSLDKLVARAPVNIFYLQKKEMRWATAYNPWWHVMGNPWWQCFFFFKQGKRCINFIDIQVNSPSIYDIKVFFLIFLGGTELPFFS